MREPMNGNEHGESDRGKTGTVHQVDRRHLGGSWFRVYGLGFRV
jgi:hypothetical protein